MNFFTSMPNICIYFEFDISTYLFPESNLTIIKETLICGLCYTKFGFIYSKDRSQNIDTIYIYQMLLDSRKIRN